jgi:hypothetical protein
VASARETSLQRVRVVEPTLAPGELDEAVLRFPS